MKKNHFKKKKENKRAYNELIEDSGTVKHIHINKTL